MRSSLRTGDASTFTARKLSSDLGALAQDQLESKNIPTLSLGSGGRSFNIRKALVRLQEAIFTLRPDVIIETGVAHGGSLIFYASLFKAMGSEGRVVGVDIEIRHQNRRAIETDELASYITLIEGDSAAPDVVNHARGLVRPGDKVLVILDSSHAKAHVAKELEAYASLVTPGSYIVATDGIMGLVHDNAAR